MIFVVAFVFTSSLKNQDCVVTEEYIKGPVTQIRDGDTLEVCEIPIRLSLVNTPEKGEIKAAGTKLAHDLCNIGGIATVLIDKQQEMSYDRRIGVIYCKGINLNEQLLKKGLAEILTYYCERSDFGDSEWARKYGC